VTIQAETLMKPDMAPDNSPALPSRFLEAINPWAARLLRQRLEGIRYGELILRESGNTCRYGGITADFPVSVCIDVLQPSFYGQCVLGGSLGAAESYLDAAWQCSDLTGLIRLLLRNHAVLDGLDGPLSGLARLTRQLGHAARRNTETGSRRNIQAHYDLGNDFFGLFLDETLTYSCAHFDRPGMSLREAQIAKLDRVCQRLALKPSDRVMEIGTGWGSFALHAARHYGCHVTTTTLSENQYRLASERVRAEGLEDRIVLLKQDYRELQGQFDKLVSIEMIEAVGHQYYPVFFSQCAALLKPEGLMLLQAITLNDRYYKRARDDVDFIKRYIFPGSCIPALSALIEAATRSSDLQVISLDDFGPMHYATTLKLWREAFLAQREAVRALGYPETFIRLWEYYLAYCEGGYREHALGDVHLLMARPLYRGA